MIQHLDLLLFHLVNSWCGHWALDRIVGYEERNQLLKGGLMLTAYWWFWFAGSGPRRDANRQRIVEALAGVFVALVLARTLAAVLPFRVRPMYVPGIGYHAPSMPLDMNLENWSSFPSDMAALFFALSFGLFRLSRPVGAVLMLWSAVWACLPRLYLGIHYPSDLVAGAALGVATVWATTGVLRARGAALGRWIMARIGSAEKRWPQVFYAAAFALSFEITMIFNDLRNLVRGVLHALRSGGFGAMNEAGALFVTFGAILLLAGILGGTLWVLVRRRAGRRPELPRASGPMPQR